MVAVVNGLTRQQVEGKVNMERKRLQFERQRNENRPRAPSGWTRFTEPGRSFRAKLSIWKQGSIALNQGACRRYEISDGDHAILYYQHEPPAIGIRLTDDPHEEGAVAVWKRSTSAVISGKSFVDCFDLWQYASGSYELRKDEASGLLVAELEQR